MLLSDKTKKTVKTALIVLSCASVLLNIWLGWQLFTAAQAFQSAQMDARMLTFTQMFVEKVLMASTEIDFDTRLALETAVRNLNDQQIFNQWQAFTKSSTKEEASNAAKLLLNMLIKKVGKNPAGFLPFSF